MLSSLTMRLSHLLAGAGAGVYQESRAQARLWRSRRAQVPRQQRHLRSSAFQCAFRRPVQCLLCRRLTAHSCARTRPHLLPLLAPSPPPPSPSLLCMCAVTTAAAPACKTFASASIRVCCESSSMPWSGAPPPSTCRSGGCDCMCACGTCGSAVPTGLPLCSIIPLELWLPGACTCAALIDEYTA
jgi:hypothetical protein